MTDRIDFERRLEERLRARATIAVRPFDAGAIAHRAAAAGGRPGLGWPRLPSVARLVLLAIVLLAIVSSVVLVGAQLLRVPRVDHDLRFAPLTNAPGTRGWLGALSDGRVLIGPAPGTTYDPGDGRASLWDPIAGTLTSTGRMVVPDRSISGVTLDDGRILIAGGDQDHSAGADGSPGYPTAEVYDPTTGTFTSLGRLPDPVLFDHGVRLADGRVLFTGGSAVAGDPPVYRPLAVSEIFDPRTNTFTRTGGLKTPRLGPDVVALADRRVLVVGGRLAGANGTESPVTGSAEIYDPATGQFSATGSLPAIPRDTVGYRYPLGEWGPLVALPDGRALVVGLRCIEDRDFVGGVSSGAAPTATYIYDPRSGTFTAGPPMPHCVERAYTLPDGRVFVVGWWYDGTDTATLENGMNGAQKRWSAVLDPTTGTLTDAGRPPDNVEYVYAQWLPLPDGRILVSSAYDHRTFILANAP